MKCIHQQEDALYFQASYNNFKAAVLLGTECVFMITRKVFEYWQNDPERIGRNHTYYPDRANKTDWITTNYRGRREIGVKISRLFAVIFYS